jgi:hypothetical protein
MCACRETDVRKSAEKFHPFYAAAVFPWWLNALYNAAVNYTKICGRSSLRPQLILERNQHIPA